MSGRHVELCHELTNFVNQPYGCAVSTLNVSLPEPMRAFVDEQVDGGQYATASAYVQQLIRRDQARARVRALIVDSLEDHRPSVPWEQVQREMRDRVARAGA